MTQVRYHTFQRPLDSFSENRRTLGVMNAGRYRGFDTFNQGGALDGTLLHTTTGVIKTDVALAVSNPMGALITPQGVMIYETAAVAIAGFASNVGNNDRLDLIICEHVYLASVGGQAATYSVIAGTPASSPNDLPAAPALTNPEKQVIIGTMFVPAGDVNLNNAIFTAGIPTILNGEGLALLDQAQQFSKTQSWSRGTDTEVDANGAIKLEGDGNLYSCALNNLTADFISNVPIGTVIRLSLTPGSEIQCTFNNLAGSAPVGYANIQPFGSLVFVPGDTLTLQRQDDPVNTWELLSSSSNSSDIVTNAADIAALEGGALPLGVNTDNALLKTKVIQIGDWDMDADVSISLAHGIGDFSKIRSVTAIIISDTSTIVQPLNKFGTQVEGGVTFWDAANIGLARLGGGFFDDAAYDDLAFNRGFITIIYEA